MLFSTSTIITMVVVIIVIIICIIKGMEFELVFLLLHFSQIQMEVLDPWDCSRRHRDQRNLILHHGGS